MKKESQRLMMLVFLLVGAALIGKWVLGLLLIGIAVTWAYNEEEKKKEKEEKKK